MSLPPSVALACPRQVRFGTLSILLTGVLVATSVLIPTSSANADATAGTFTIGAAAVQLNQPSDPDMGNLTPTADAATNGMFGAVVAWPVIPLHVAMARNGHVISYGTPLDVAAQSGLVYDDWNVAGGFARDAHTDTASMHGYNAFCSSLIELEDARLLMIGGNSSANTMLYDPATGAQDMTTDLAQQRWYGTTLRLTDNRILVLGGANLYNSAAWKNPDDSSTVATTPEIGSGTGAWTQLIGATSTYAFGSENNRWWYPRAFNGPGGTVFGFSGDHMWTLNPDGQGSVQQVGTLPYNPNVSGSQVMYAPGKILMAGGGQVYEAEPVAGTANAAVVDISSGTPAATMIAPMANARNWLNLTVLPTGEVFANGGTRFGFEPGEANSVKQAEIWNPATGLWRLSASAQRTRTYHSVSMMMPSGAVFTGGGGVPGPEVNLNAELYYPSYLFAKAADGSVTWAKRPTIESIAGSATWGGAVTMTVGGGRAIGSASLISSPTVTHAQNTDQRRIPLQITQTNRVVKATLPASMDTMPPGDYQLTVVDDQGVPSAAQTITIRTGAAGQVTVPAGFSTTGVGSGDGSATQPDVVSDGLTAATATAAEGTALGGATAANAAAAASAAAEAGAAGKPGADAGGATAVAPAPVATAAPSAPVSGGADPSARRLSPRSVIGIEAAASPGWLVTGRGQNVVLRKGSRFDSRIERRAASWRVHALRGSKGEYLLESTARPGHYLAAPAGGAGRTVLLKRTGSEAFRARAVFRAVAGATSGDTSFQLAESAHRYLTRRGTVLLLKAAGESSEARAAVAFRIVKHAASRR